MLGKSYCTFALPGELLDWVQYSGPRNVGRIFSRVVGVVCLCVFLPLCVVERVHATRL